MKQKSEMKNFIFILLLIICVALAGYFAGAQRSKTTADKKQRAVDSLNICLKAQNAAFITAVQQIAVENAKHNDNFLMINEIKKAIRNEIKNQEHSIYSLPDSALQSFVDSIRNNGGIK